MGLGEMPQAEMAAVYVEDFFLCVEVCGRSGPPCACLHSDACLWHPFVVVALPQTTVTSNNAVHVHKGVHPNASVAMDSQGICFPAAVWLFLLGIKPGVRAYSQSAPVHECPRILDTLVRGGCTQS